MKAVKIPVPSGKLWLEFWEILVFLGLVFTKREADEMVTRNDLELINLPVDFSKNGHIKCDKLLVKDSSQMLNIDNNYLISSDAFDVIVMLRSHKLFTEADLRKNGSDRRTRIPEHNRIRRTSKQPVNV